VTPEKKLEEQETQESDALSYPLKRNPKKAFERSDLLFAGFISMH
jgi:hypothetical protein